MASLPKVKISKAEKAKAKASVEAIPFPPATDYYVNYATLNADTCQARQLDDADTRFTPHIFREFQCGRKKQAGSDLCSHCIKREAKYAFQPDHKTGWNGRIMEHPLPTSHMLGTAWSDGLITAGKLKFKLPSLSPSSPSPSPSPSLEGGGAVSGPFPSLPLPLPLPLPLHQDPYAGELEFLRHERARLIQQLEAIRAIVMSP